MDNKELLANVFGYKPQVTTPPPPPFVPDLSKHQKKWEDKQPVVRDIPAETTASVQAIVWGQGVPPPPKPKVGLKDQGTASAMEPPTGWGKTNG